MAKELRDDLGALISIRGCAAHLVHRVIVTAINETKLLGDIHAVSFAMGIPSHRQTAHRVLWDMLQDESFFATSYAAPTPEWEKHKLGILSHTMLRVEDWCGV